MKTLKLYEQLKRLLEYSGTKVEDISLTKDGAVATVWFDGEQTTLFISKKQPISRDRILECAIANGF